MSRLQDEDAKILRRWRTLNRLRVFSIELHLGHSAIHHVQEDMYRYPVAVLSLRLDWNTPDNFCPRPVSHDDLKAPVYVYSPNLGTVHLLPQSHIPRELRRKEGHQDLVLML